MFGEVADRLEIQANHIEKDFWVCLVLDTVFNRLPDGHPRILFKGGTSLSKVFNLIHRFSEDVDIVVYPEDLGFDPESDRAALKQASNSRRKKLSQEYKRVCDRYIQNEFAEALRVNLGEVTISISPDETSDNQQILLVEYPTLYPGEESGYVQPHVKIEAECRTGRRPNTTEHIKPYIAGDLPEDWPFKVENLHVLSPTRTYLEKLLVLHGVHCRYRDEEYLPRNEDRISRHYYDVAMMTGTEVGMSALADRTLLEDVRDHDLIFLRQQWKRLEEVEPGTIMLVPQEELRATIERDYEATVRMIMGKPPNFAWIMEQIEIAEETINSISDAHH